MFIPYFRLKTTVQRLLCAYRDICDYPRFHPLRKIKNISLQETVKYIKTNMPDAIGVWTPRQLLDIAIREAKVDGHFVEFGVFRGGTIKYIAKQRPELIVHGFDSFYGLPESWSILEKGTFSLLGKPPKVPRNVIIHQGLFSVSLPRWAKIYVGPIAFAHVDCDTYSSTQTIFNELSSRFVPGTIIVFDDFFGYPNWKNHGFKAFEEFTTKHAISFDYIAYAKTQVAVRVL